MSDYTPTTDEMLDGYVTMRGREIPGDRVLASVQALGEAERWLAAHDAEKRAEWEAEQGGHIVPCARCGQRKVIASDALNSDIEVCGRCGTEIGLRELAEQGAEEPEWDTIVKLRDQIEEARNAWWSATEQGDNGLIYTDRIEDAMDDIWSAIGHAEWMPVEQEGEQP
jgi:hypothetical protein